MNILSKRIRKLRRAKVSAPVPEKTDDPEMIYISIANLSSDITETQFSQIVTSDVIHKILSAINSLNPNALHALTNIMRIGYQFGEQTIQYLSSVGLLNLLTNIKLEMNLLYPYLMVAIEIFETWNVKQLGQYYQRILQVLEDIANNIYGEDILYEALNLLQILSEIDEINIDQNLVKKYYENFKGDNQIIQKFDFGKIQEFKCMLLITLLNINVLEIQIAMDVLNINIFQELDNIECLLNKQALMEEEGQNNSVDERLQSALKIWECSAQSIIQSLFFFNKLYEFDDFEDEDEDDENDEINQNKQQQQQQQFTYCNKFPQCFQPQLINQLITIIHQNYFNINHLIQRKLIQYTTTFTELIQNIGVTIFNSSLLLLGQLIHLNQNNNIDTIIQQCLPQIEGVCSTQLLSISDQEELLKQYFKYLNTTLTLATPQQIFIIPEQWPLSMIQQLKLDSQFHLLEVMKKRYSTKQKLQLQTVQQVTQYLLKLMDQNDNIMLIAYSLDCFFDVYTEEDYNNILVEQNLLNVLNYGHSQLKNKLNNFKKVLSKEDYSFFRLTLVNLGRFIEYKMNILK